MNTDIPDEAAEAWRTFAKAFNISQDAKIRQRLYEIGKEFEDREKATEEKRVRNHKTNQEILEVMHGPHAPYWKDGPTPAEGRRYLRERNELAERVLVLNEEISNASEKIFELEGDINDVNSDNESMKRQLNQADEQIRNGDLALAEKIELASRFRKSLEAAEKVLKTSQEENAALRQEVREANEEANRLSGPDRWAAANVTLENVDPTLLWLLRRCADEWGWEGVVRTAYRLQQEVKRLASQETRPPRVTNEPRVLKDNPQA